MKFIILFIVSLSAQAEIINLMATPTYDNGQTQQINVGALMNRDNYRTARQAEPDQQSIRNYYNANGDRVGSSRTNDDGGTVYFDGEGNVIGRSR